MKNSNHPQFEPGFVVLHGNRTEDLRDLLTGIYKAQPLPPLWSEVILVQSNGMKHWLELALADDAALGICSATRLELPSKYMWQVYRSVLGVHQVPKHMPFDKDSLVWRLYRMLPELVLLNPVYQPLQHYLKKATDGRKLYQLAAQIADVFDAYQNYRADWLLDWSLGRDVLIDNANKTQALAPDLMWQAQLWRDISDDIGTEWGTSSRSSVHQKFMAIMPSVAQEYQKSKKLPYGIPPRITVFGVSSMPMQMVEALAELGRVCQVFVLVQNPCQHYWGDLIEDKYLHRDLMWKRHIPKIALSHSQDSALALHNSNPLLASWGKQGRDYLHLLDKFDEVEAYKNRYAKIELFIDPARSENQSVLSLVQSAIFNLETSIKVTTDFQPDNSIELVSTFSAMREVQVLHDKILNWLDQDKNCLPGDIMVMVPDMESFAAAIHAVFGKFKRGEKRFIPYSVADSALTQSPLILALEQILALDTSRISLEECFGMLEVPAILKRFSLDEIAVEKLKNWLSSAGIRWGLDAQHRRQWDMPITGEDYEQNTWKFGLNRLILGYALGISAQEAMQLQDSQNSQNSHAGIQANGVWCNNLALTAISSLDGPVVDGLLAWVEAITITIDELQSHQSPEQWKDFIQTVLSRFFTATTDQETALLQKLNETAQAWFDRCEEASLNTKLPIEVVREHYLSQVQEPSIHQRFFGGGVQFATLMPMRSIPFKILALLGMNDGQYPRQKTSTDFDLMTKNWRVGDRSRREDDRYLFLEAILAARQKLYISWQGVSSQDNSEKPPSVLVAQLIEYLNQNFNSNFQPKIYPLQPFSKWYFDAKTDYVTYDKDWDLNQNQLAQELDPLINENFNKLHSTELQNYPKELDIEQLAQFLKQPVEAFFRQRLGVYFENLKELNATDEPFNLKKLDEYQLTDHLSRSIVESRVQAEIQKMELSGSLPLAGFKKCFSEDITEKALTLNSKKLELNQSWPHKMPSQAYSLEIQIEPPSSYLSVALSTPSNQSNSLSSMQQAIVLNGVLKDLFKHEANDRYMILETRPGAVINNQHIRPEVMASMWVQHLFACALGIPLTSYKVGLDDVVVLKTIDSATAQGFLKQLLLAYLNMWNELPRIACKTAWSLLIELKKLEDNDLSLTDLNSLDELSDDSLQAIHDELHHKASLVFEDEYAFPELKSSSYLSRVFTSYEDIKSDIFILTDILYSPLFEHANLLGQASHDD